MITDQHHLLCFRESDWYKRFKFHAHAAFINDTLLNVITGSGNPTATSNRARAQDNLGS